MDTPNDLRARRFRLGGDDYLVLSFRLARGPAAALTRAEREVARGLIAGASNAQIARERGRSVNTIAKQARSVYEKLGVSSRIDLACVLSHVGLEDADEGG